MLREEVGSSFTIGAPLNETEQSALALCENMLRPLGLFGIGLGPIITLVVVL